MHRFARVDERERRSRPAARRPCWMPPIGSCSRRPGDSPRARIGPGVMRRCRRLRQRARPTASRTRTRSPGRTPATSWCSFAPVGRWPRRLRRLGAGVGTHGVSLRRRRRRALSSSARRCRSPESHYADGRVGAGAHLGAATLDVEGAASRHDLNTFSSRDDGDNNRAAPAVPRWRSRAGPGALGGRGLLTLEGRGVEAASRRSSTSRTPFEAEHWGLPAQVGFRTLAARGPRSPVGLPDWRWPVERRTAASSARRTASRRRCAALDWGARGRR